MEAYRFVLCCVLFATVACWSIHDRSDSGDGGLPEVFQSHSKCKCSNGRCFTDNRGNVKCVCKPGYALQEEFTCKKCDCGSKGKCLFTLTPKLRGEFTYEKKCVCDVGSAEKDGKCIDCYCGNNSACEFNGEEKNCYCIEGYSEKDGVCTKCDCGFYGKCEFKNGIKQCECDEGTLEFDGVCEECDCGEHGTCTFMDGAKYCECKDGYQENKGVCEECYCGENSIGCHFFGGMKYCKCREKFSDKGGSCEVCDCGPYASDCSFFMNEQKCTCAAGYVQKRNSCEVGCGYDHPCKNGGRCSGGYCGCLPGTSGEFCEVIDECDRLCPQQRDVRCAYDAALQKPFCECLDHNLRFDPERKQCHKPCDETAKCVNRGECTPSGFSSFCRCISGTEGEFCEVITGCKSKDCGSDAECKLDVMTGGAVCSCKDFQLSFDALDKRCRRPCSDTQVCRNGGACVGTGFESFCRCLQGTEGDFCEQVPECSRMNCGADARCGFDVSEGRAVCQCRDPQLAFDPRDRRCKNYCLEDAVCANGGRCEGNSNFKFCNCSEGIAGDYCDVVVGCAQMDCGKDAICGYDALSKTAVCSCLDSGKKFDRESKTCRRPCSDTQVCRNGGACVGTGFESFCRCVQGTEGDFCEQVPECSLMNCGADALCGFDVSEGRAVCQCRHPQLAFDPRDRRCKNYCLEDAVCANGGRCEGNSDFKFCNCSEGIAGDYCDIVVGCGYMDCGKDAICGYDALSKTAVCSCLDSGKKFDKESKTCKRGCRDDSGCSNGGSCRSRGWFDAFCDCLPGTGGDVCETVDDCKEGRTRCKGGARCVFDQRRRQGACECPDGKERYDTVGEQCKPTCDGNGTCHNRGLCMPRGDHTFCECKVGTSGHLCETVDECRRGLCGHGSDVECLYDAAKEAAVCRCRSKEHLFDPASKACKACDCGKKEVSCRYEDGRKVCVCRDGYDARNGTCQKVRCTEKSCHNGQCRVVGDEEVCSCFEGFTLEGDHCKKLNCSKTPCFNGTCIVRHGNREECVCQAGYTLKDGACIRGACRVDTCFGGYCDVIEGELMCICPKNYSLQGIGCFATVCRKQHCFGGWCYVNEDKEEICTCHKGYVLVNDVCKKILCNKPCFGGQCQFVDGKEECICPPGYTIFKDVCRDNRIPKRKN